MGREHELIAATDRPATVATLTEDLRALGLARGDVAIVHSALSALGWVAGGAQAVVEALLETVGPDGTIVMPTQSGQLTDPIRWSRPPVPADWVATLRASLPAYDPHLTPTRSMGQVVECFRHHPEARRSSHPTVSFAAVGPRTETILDPHPLSDGLGEGSPLARLYQLDAKVVLLGVGHLNDTSLHLAEHRATWPGKARRHDGAPVTRDGARAWARFEDLEPDDSDFDRIGAAFAAAGHERTGPVGTGTGRLSRQRALVDFATSWMTEHRPARPDSAHPGTGSPSQPSPPPGPRASARAPR